MRVEGSELSVERSAPCGAVFLSYASQDAEAARRIADALRAAGVEVWFDQSELVGGDAWDAKIRKQIKDCALFVPVISANTQSRTEGYFRLEWRLADQRTHLMAKGRPFLLPVVIDDTKDSDAAVPDSFTEVQWTKAPGGVVPSAFAARVQRLLNGEPAARPPRQTAPALSDSPARGAKYPWLFSAVAGVLAVIALAVWQPWKNARLESGVAKPSAPATSPVSEARKLANQAMQLIEDPNFTRESLWLADELCERALKLDTGDAETWAAAALVSVNLYWNSYDTSATRRGKMSSQATSASQLDPRSVRAALAVARSQDLNYEKEDSLRMLRELHRRAPEDQQVIFHLIRAEGAQGNEAAVQALLRKLRAFPRTGMLRLTQWFVILRLRSDARFAEADAILDEMLSGSEQLRGAYYEKLQLLMTSWHDLAEVEPFIERIPERYRQEPAFGSAIAQYWLWRAQPEKVLQALVQVSQDYFGEYYANEPKAYHSGWAHAVAHRSAAAQAEWSSALALIEERLKTDSRNFTLLNQRALLLALTGQSAAARDAWRLRVELGGVNAQPFFETEVQVMLALNESERAITVIEQAWPSIPPGAKARLLPTFRYHPAFASIRDDARMQRIFADGTAMMQRLKTEQTGVGQPAGPAPTDTSGPVSIKADDKSVAVLAFANLSDDKANEYFSDGISEELLTVLQKIPGLHVAARTSAFSFKGKNATAQEIGTKLGVANLVEGSVQKSGARVKVTARLSRVITGEELWSRSYTRELKDAFALQEELATAIVGELRGQLGGIEAAAAVRAAVRGGTTDAEAHQLFLQGRYFQGRFSMENLNKAVGLFGRAVELDPKFALAWAALSRAHAMHVGWADRMTQPEFEAELAQARRAADRALELEPDMPEALNARFEVQFNYDFDWQGGVALMRRALALAPSDPVMLSAASRVAGIFGDRDRAVELVRQAVAFDPVNAEVRVYLGLALINDHRWAEARSEFARVAELSPATPWAFAGVGLAYLYEGKYAEALAALEHEQTEFARQLVAAIALWGQKKTAEADAMLAQTIKVNGDVGAYQIAAIYGFRGDKDQAFAWLERARRQRDAGLVVFTNDPFFDSLRSDPRWTAFQRSMGLPPEPSK